MFQWECLQHCFERCRPGIKRRPYLGLVLPWCPFKVSHQLQTFPMEMPSAKWKQPRPLKSEIPGLGWGGTQCHHERIKTEIKLTRFWIVCVYVPCKRSISGTAWHSPYMQPGAHRAWTGHWQASGTSDTVSWWRGGCHRQSGCWTWGLVPCWLQWPQMMK